MRAYRSNVVLKLATYLVVLGLLHGCSPAAAGKAGYNPGLHVRKESTQGLAEVSVVEVLPVTFEREAAFLFAAEEQPAELVRNLVSRYASINLRDPAVEDLAVADSKLKVHVVKGRERLGGRLGAEKGAMILLKVELSDASSGVPLWVGDYFYKDQPLSDNILDLGKRSQEKERAGWLSFRELFAQGMKESLHAMNQRREQLSGAGKLAQ